MRYLILLLLTFLVSHAFAQSSACDSIVWHTDRKLTWDDFKGTPEAITNVGVRTHYSFSRSWGAHGATLKTKMVCFFSPCKSWVKGKRSPGLLMHEQGIFDIAEYFRRTYNKKVSEAKYSPATIRAVMMDLYKEVLNECGAVEKAYDGETLFGRNEEAQQQWNRKINDMLASLQDYDREEMVIPLSNKTDDPFLSFSKLLGRAQLIFTAPAGMTAVPIITNGQMSYDYALKLPDKDYEVRYAIRPLDTAVKEYEAWKNKKGDEIRADPNNLDKPAFTATMMNISGGKREQPADFPNQAIRNCFNADWG